MVKITTRQRTVFESYTLTFTYDAQGNPQTVDHNGTLYYYVTNLQGDVVTIVDSSGNIMVSYSYDAWGNHLSTTGTLSATLGTLNPLRYRGYVFNHETGLNYLQSRYYNSTTGRFINADALTSTGQGELGNNMFAYCNNSPILSEDSSGFAHIPTTVVVNDGAGGDPGPFGILTSNYYAELDSEFNRPYTMHSSVQWFDTDYPTFLTATDSGFELISWSFSLFSKNYYLHKEEDSSLYISLLNVDAYAGFDIKEGFGFDFSAGLFSCGYSGQYVSSSFDAFTMSATCLYQDGLMHLGFSPGIAGAGLSLDIPAIWAALFGGK